MYLRIAIVSLTLLSLTATACTKKVALKKSAYNVEIASASAVAASRLECDELERVVVTTMPNERPESDRWSVEEIKVRNAAASLDATHVVWNDRETFPCDRSGERIAEGTKEAKNARQCKRLSAMSYQCMVGRAPSL
jgi:hypothetical protein